MNRPHAQTPIVARLCRRALALATCVALLLTPLTYFGFLLSLPWFVAVSLTLAVKTIRLPATGLVSRPV